MQDLDRHRLVVSEPQALDPDDPRRRRDVQGPAEVGSGVDLLKLERSRARHHAAAAHVLAERRERELLRDLRVADERAAPVPADKKPVADEVLDRGAQRQPRDAEVAREPSLGRDRLADVEAFDQLEHPLPGLFLLVHGRGIEA